MEAESGPVLDVSCQGCFFHLYSGFFPHLNNVFMGYFIFLCHPSGATCVQTKEERHGSI